MSLYSSVNPGIKIYQNFENRGYENIADIAFGDLIPVGHLLCMPGEYIHINNSAFVRTIPMFAPVFGNVKIRLYNFAVPIRILDDDAANIIKGYDDDGTEVQGSLPGMYETSYNVDNPFAPQWSFWDYMSWNLCKIQNLPQLAMPAKYWYQGYVKIWNEYFRDQNYQEEIDVDDLLFDDDSKPTGGKILKVNFKKDYFTSATPELLKGEIPSLGLGGNAAVDFSHVFPTMGSTTDFTSGTGSLTPNLKVISEAGQPLVYDAVIGSGSQSTYNNGNATVKASYDALQAGNLTAFNKAFVSAAGLGTFDVSQLRQLFAYTRIKERASRCGSRYTEYLRSNFGVAPRDERMQRPEFLGGCSSPIIVNEVTQTSAATEDSAQGNLSGKGTSLVGSRQHGYLCTEFMLIYTLAAVVPDAMYSTGIDRTDTIKNRFDFPNPSFQNLSEQAVHGYELYAAGDKDGDEWLDEKIIGYQGRYNEFRRSQSHVTGAFRSSLNYWHLSREFAQRPFINSDFLEVNASTNNLNRIFNALDDNQYKPFYLHVYNGYKVKQPLVKNPVPGLIDHN